MLKVVCLVDKTGTALDRLAQGVAKYHDNLNYVVVDFHPKRPDQQQIDNLLKHADADIIDAQYYRSMEKVREMFPQFRAIPTILTHNNPYAIEEKDWNDYSLNVGNNKYITKRLKEITKMIVEYIPLTVDTDFWTFNRDWECRLNVIMVANRIEGKKGVLPVAQACAKLNMRMKLVGAVSDKEYWYEVMRTGVVDYYPTISDEELRQHYYNSGIHVCNSVDNFESGTLPILESMLCGVPVLTRNVGHVPELNNGENMVIQDSDSDNVEAIANKLADMFMDKKKLEEQRQKGWNTAKSRSHERRAYMYQKLYRQVLFDTVPVSVVMPVYDKPDIIRKNLNAAVAQTYKNIELIIADDSDTPNKDLIDGFAETVNFPVRYIHTANNDYGLARARNVAAIEATGDVLVFVDQRMVMQPDAVAQFVTKIKPKTWLYGNKGGKKEFVENFSCVYRKEFIEFGMFNERMDAYGGLSQETRNRARRQGIQIEYVETAKADPAGKSSNKNSKKQDIIRIKSRLWKMGLE
jgi:glycosyltransferase involved in cell wall biosynthesis